MKTKLMVIMILVSVMFIGCDANQEPALSSDYLGTWIAQSYDVDGTANDYTLSDLSTDPNEVKTYKFIITEDSYTQYNLAGTLKVQCSIIPVSESSFDFTISDQGLDNMAVGESAFWDIIKNDNGSLTLNAYWDSTKASGIIATYILLGE